MITIKQALKVDDVRLFISQLINVPLNRVLEWGVQQDVSKLPFFITVQMGSSLRKGQSKKFNSTNETETIKSQRETDVTISLHGENAFIMANFAVDCLKSEPSKQLFDTMKAGLVNHDTVRDLTIPFAGGYEERAEFHMILSHDFIIEYKQNKISSVEIGLVLNQ